MARSTRNPKCNHTVDYYLLNYYSGLCRQHYIILYGFKYTVRVIQTHTVGFCGPFRSRSVTLLLDPTTLGKPDFRSRTLVRRRTHSDLDYLLKYTQRYTVAYLWPIRSLLDPFQVSHTIIGTSDSLGLPRTHSELPGLGLSP